MCVMSEQPVEPTSNKFLCVPNGNRDVCATCLIKQLGDNLKQRGGQGVRVLGDALARE